MLLSAVMSLGAMWIIVSMTFGLSAALLLEDLTNTQRFFLFLLFPLVIAADGVESACRWFLDLFKPEEAPDVE